MRSIAVSVDSLGKRYRLGELRSADSIRDVAGRTLSRLLGRRRASNEDDSWLWAIKDLSFEVRRGDAIGIIGRNGAGKSTLLKVLSRITPPTEGEATLHGRVASLLEVGSGFHGDLTGRENVYLNAAILGMSVRDTRQRFDEIVAFSGVERFLDTPVKRYSSGMYVRLAFAVAAHLDPEVLIVDEVLAVGDMRFQQRCLQRMRQVAGDGRTVIFVSHNMGSISALCQRVLLLEEGRLVVDGSPQEAVARYLGQTELDAGERVWLQPELAPGDERVRLRAVGIYQDGQPGPTSRVVISRPIRVRIAYECLAPGSRLYAALWLRDRMSVDVLASANAPGMTLAEDPWYGRPHPTGTYVAECVLPADTLNDGPYSVTPIIGEVPSRTIALAEDAIRFSVVDDGSMRAEYTGHWIGCVRPRLAWSSRRTDRGLET